MFYIRVDGGRPLGTEQREGDELMGKKRGARRKLKRAWERRGYQVTEDGHGRVRDGRGRLVATYALTPGTQRSEQADWLKLGNPEPLGIVRDTAGAPAGEPQREAKRDRYRITPREPQEPTVPGFRFPDFEMPQPKPLPADEEVAEAIARRKAMRDDRAVSNRVCDGCGCRSGPDTFMIGLMGSASQRARWFRLLDPATTREEARRLASRSFPYAQLCERCIARTGVSGRLTYEELLRRGRDGTLGYMPGLRLGNPGGSGAFRGPR
jgi:hypothetical protein